MPYENPGSSNICICTRDRFWFVLSEKISITFCMEEEDVLYMLSQNDFSIGSDGSGLPLHKQPEKGIPHPRNFGTFPRFLRIAREKKLCSLPVAVRRITGQSADYIGLKDRGYVKAGYVADLTVFDPEEVADRARYGSPFQKPAGIFHVFVAGKPAVLNGCQTSLRAGQILLKK